LGPFEPFLFFRECGKPQALVWLWIPGLRLVAHPGMPSGESMRLRLSRTGTGTEQKFFSIFVDRIFTTSTYAPFTNASEAVAQGPATACLCRVGNAD
jgi:hypothetical protein